MKTKEANKLIEAVEIVIQKLEKEGIFNVSVEEFCNIIVKDTTIKRIADDIMGD